VRCLSLVSLMSSANDGPTIDIRRFCRGIFVRPIVLSWLMSDAESHYRLTNIPFLKFYQLTNFSIFSLNFCRCCSIIKQILHKVQMAGHSSASHECWPNFVVENWGVSASAKKIGQTKQKPVSYYRFCWTIKVGW